MQRPPTRRAAGSSSLDDDGCSLFRSVEACQQDWEIMPNSFRLPSKFRPAPSSPPSPLRVPRLRCFLSLPCVDGPPPLCLWAAVLLVSDSQGSA